MKKFKVVVIGLGKQNLEDHLPAILQSKYLELDSVCDLIEELGVNVSEEYNVIGYTNLDKLLEERDVDIAVVAVPHNFYFPIIKKVANKGISIFKEKPFVLSLKEGLEIHNLVQKNGIKLMVALQRRVSPIFNAFLQLKDKIGKIYSIEGRYTMNISRLDEGWRAQKDIAGGGALIDMGYHSVDLLIWYFGLPDYVMGIKSIGNREGQNYNVEDTVGFSFEYNSGELNSIMGNFIVSRVYPKKEEKFTVYGSTGSIEITKGSIKRFNQSGDVIESLTQEGAWESSLVIQIDALAKDLLGEKPLGNMSYEHFFSHITFIDGIYRSINENKKVQLKNNFTL